MIDRSLVLNKDEVAVSQPSIVNTKSKKRTRDQFEA